MTFVYGCGNLVPSVEIADYALIETPLALPLRPFAPGEGVTFAGGSGDLPMRVTACGTSEVATTSARYEIFAGNASSPSSVRVTQLLDYERVLATWSVEPAAALLGLRVVSGGEHSCVLVGGGMTLGVQADGLLGFVPHQDANITLTNSIGGDFNRISNGHLLSEDDDGGLTVTPAIPLGSGRCLRGPQQCWRMSHPHVAFRPPPLCSTM